MASLILAQAGVGRDCSWRSTLTSCRLRGGTIRTYDAQLCSDEPEDWMSLFAGLPPRWIEQLTVQLDSGSTYRVADLSRLPGRHPAHYRHWCPQWDLLNVIADTSRQGTQLRADHGGGG